MEKFIDSHAHYNAYQFRKDEEETLARVFDASKLIINCGTNVREINSTLELIKKYENMYAVIGFFPVDTVSLENNQSNLAWLEERLGYEKVIGLGEIGLDYHHNKPDPEIQKKWFIAQIELANKLHLPVCIHSRDAEEDTVDILLNNRPEYGCIIHCYSYGPRTMRKLNKIGAYYGIGGTSTYPNNKLLRNAIKQMPLDRIILETDAPYLSPQEKRGKRNDSENIKYVIENLSELLDIPQEEIIKITNENVFNAYPALKLYMK